MSGTSSHSIMIHDAPQKLSQPFVSFHVEIFFLTLLGLDGSLGGHFHVEILFTIIHNYNFLCWTPVFSLRVHFECLYQRVQMNLWYRLFVQDKWRNLSVTAGGYGSREKARMALKKGRRVVPKLTAEPMDVDGKDMDIAHDAIIEAEPLAMALEPLAIEESPDKSVARSVYSVQIFIKTIYCLYE
jgi:hypothetical protein